MGKFKVGDIIRGLNDKYGITNTEMTRAEVKVVNEDENVMAIKILEHPNYISHFNDWDIYVDMNDDFELVEAAPETQQCFAKEYKEYKSMWVDVGDGNEDEDWGEWAESTKTATLPNAIYEMHPYPLTNPKFLRHKELCEQMHETYKKKNLDYGDSFSKSIEKWGFIAAMVRMEDKFNRLESLLGKSEEEILVKDESIIDTLLDLSAYAMMTAMEFEVRKKDDKKEEGE